MTPEIREAVKTLAAAFQTILEALAREETPKPKPCATQPLAPDEPEFLPPPRHLGTLPVDWLRRR
jgi:hypothetical protein